MAQNYVIGLHYKAEVGYICLELRWNDKIEMASLI